MDKSFAVSLVSPLVSSEFQTRLVAAEGRCIVTEWVLNHIALSICLAALAYKMDFMVSAQTGW